MMLHFLNDVANDAESSQKMKVTSQLLVWRVKQFASFANIKFTRLGFENAC